MLCIHSAAAGMSTLTPDFKTPPTVKYRDLAGGDLFIQHCSKSFGKGLNVNGGFIYM